MLLGDFKKNFVVAVSNPLPDEIIGQTSRNIQLVPKFLVHVPSTCYFRMEFSKLDSPFRVAFQDKPFSVFQIEHGKYFSVYAKSQRRFIEWKVLSDLRERETILSNSFYIHGCSEEDWRVRAGR